jgi:DNA-binding transcriptional regulator YdaS (Cro superfamily)
MPKPNYTPEHRHRIAALLQIDEQYLYQIVRGLKTASPALARKIHEIDASFKLEDLRPNDYWIIWPDLPAPVDIAPAATEAVAQGA